MIVSPDGRSQSASVFYRQIERRFSTRLDYVCDYLGIEVTDRNPETVDLDSIDRHVEEHLATAD